MRYIVFLPVGIVGPFRCREDYNRPTYRRGAFDEEWWQVFCRIRDSVKPIPLDYVELGLSSITTYTEEELRAYFSRDSTLKRELTLYGRDADLLIRDLRIRAARLKVLGAL